MNDRPIGVFDSGLGGLTTVKELRRILPGEDIVYFGDTGRVPYGTRGQEIIISYAKQDIAFLLTQGVKTVLAACGTVSSTLPAEQLQGLPVPYTGVVQPAVQAACKATKNGRVGIIATEATVASGCYQSALQHRNPQIQSVATACPLFVPLVENGYFTHDNPVVQLVVADYLAPIQKAEVDTLIMGCTHYPLLRDTIQKNLEPGVTLLDVGQEAARSLKADLEKNGMLSGRTQGGRVHYFVSDAPSRFSQLAHIFLGEYGGEEATRINIENYKL